MQDKIRNNNIEHSIGALLPVYIYTYNIIILYEQPINLFFVSKKQIVLFFFLLSEVVSLSLDSYKWIKHACVIIKNQKQIKIETVTLYIIFHPKLYFNLVGIIIYIYSHLHSICNVVLMKYDRIIYTTSEHCIIFTNFMKI